MPSRKAILAAATLLSVFPLGPVAAFAQTERTLTEAPAQTGPVSVTFDRAEARYAIGEVVGMFIQSAEDAYVTVLNVSPSGSVIKLFPNKYQTESFVAAGKRVQVPDPASGARLQVSGPVGKEQIKVFYSSKPLTIFADLGSGGAGMFRSIDGGMEEVARSLDEARSLGAKISSTTLTLTTVDSLPAPPAAPPVAALPEVTPKPAEQTATLVEPKKPAAAADKPKLAPKPKKKVVEKPKRPAPKLAQVKRKPKSYKIVTHLKPGQVLAEDELELLGRVPDNTLPASSLRPYNPQSAY
ncbi:MAG TPA: DUF4384 domain-containing protein, partial [Mycoplana sp.]|nr:DUF4384 domain-containing protein [Mycoplana sp.]